MRQQLLDAIGHGDDVGPGLALDIHDHRRRLVHPRGLAGVFRVVFHRGHVRQFHGRGVPVGDDDFGVVAAREQLVVGADLKRLIAAIEVALGLIHIGGRDSAANIFEVETVRGQERGIGLDADGGLLTPADPHQPDAGELRDLRSQPRIGKILHL